MTAPRTAALAAAIRRSIVTGDETPDQMAERILADPEYATPDRERLEAAIETAWMKANKGRRVDGHVEWTVDEATVLLRFRRDGEAQFYAAIIAALREGDR